MDALHDRQRFSPHDGLSSVKRRKAQLACNYCRNRKTRCDGRQPACSPCQKRGYAQECVYEESTLSTQRHVARLEQRIKELERTNAQLSGNLGASVSRADVTSGVTEVSSMVTRAEAPVEVRANLTESMSRTAEETGDAIDGLATVSPLPLTERAAESYGGSSTIAFLRNLLVMVDGRTSIQGESGPPRSRVRPPAEQMNRSLRDVDPSALVLPSRILADSFVDAFFSIVHPLYPIVHKPTFMIGYQSLWISRSPGCGVEARDFYDTPLFWSTVNLVFALGSQFSNLVEPSRRVSLASEFHRRCRSLSDPEVLDTASIEGVQVLLLISVYLQSTHHASRCWNVLGLAIRAAQALGLHLEQRHLSCTSQLDREMGRRVWYNCVILDKLQSMTFGRPTMLSKSKVKSPQAIDDDYLLLEGDGVQPPQRQSQLTFFICSISLFDILSDVLSTIYSEATHDSSSQEQALTSSTTGTLQDILRLSSELDRFEVDMPLHLRTRSRPSFADHPEAYDQQTATFNLQANVLYCRLLYTRLILLRPILLSACANSQLKNQCCFPVSSNGSSLESHIFAHVCALCINTATALIDTIHANMHSVLRNSVWYTVYFTFSAATVLLAARICNSNRSASESASSFDIDVEGSSDGDDKRLISQASFQTAWDKVIAILDFHRDRIESAGRAVRVLEALGAKVKAAGTENLQGGILHSANVGLSQSNVTHWMETGGAYEWTADDFNTLSLSNAWFMQQISNLDFLELDH